MFTLHQWGPNVRVPSSVSQREISGYDSEIKKEYKGDRYAVRID